MAYKLGQYNKVPNKDNDIFMKENQYGVNGRLQDVANGILIGEKKEMFRNDYVSLTKENGELINFDNTKNYYFHGQIKRMSSAQTFYVKLVYNSNDPEQRSIEQYLQTITITPYVQNVNEPWADIEFIFRPIENFECLLFELSRNTQDYTMPRYAHIAYLEISEIKNLLENETYFQKKTDKNIALIKAGVQSHPSLMMCLNDEEFRTCRTGIYEFKNSIITLYFFSVVNSLKFEDNGVALKAWEDQIDHEIDELDEYKRTHPSATYDEITAMEEAIKSKVFFKSSGENSFPKKSRVIDSFTLDYMYKES